MFKKKRYEINVLCDNCDQRSSVKIPKGLTIDEHLSSGKGLCPNCGCPISLEYQQLMEGEGKLNVWVSEK